MSFQCHFNDSEKKGAVARATGHQGFGPQNLRNNGFNLMSIKKVFFVFHLYFICYRNISFSILFSICYSFLFFVFRSWLFLL